MAGSNTVCLVVPTLCVLVKVMASEMCLLHGSQDAKDPRWNQGPSNSCKGMLPITYEAPLDKGSNTSQEYQGLGLILLLMRLQHFRSKLKRQLMSNSYLPCIILRTLKQTIYVENIVWSQAIVLAVIFFPKMFSYLTWTCLPYRTSVEQN